MNVQEGRGRHDDDLNRHACNTSCSKDGSWSKGGDPSQIVYYDDN